VLIEIVFSRPELAGEGIHAEPRRHLLRDNHRPRAALGLSSSSLRRIWCANLAMLLAMIFPSA
jgi:hypothetical protein